MSAHRSESFHNRHEEFTDRAYEDETLLPYRYVFVLTNLCNLACPFCFLDRSPRRAAMTTQDWLDLVGQLPEHSRVTLTGGEPLMFKGLREVFAAVAEKKCDCNIITNGLLLTEEEIDFVADQVITAVKRLRVLSPLYEMVQEGIDLSTIAWTGH